MPEAYVWLTRVSENAMEEIETVKAASRLQGPGQREEAVNRLRGLETSGRNLCAQLGLDSSQEGLGRIGGKLAGHIGENRYIVSYATDNLSLIHI